MCSLNAPVTVSIYNPQWDFAKWSEYPNLHSIALMYRRADHSEWSHALDESNSPIFFQYILPMVLYIYNLSFQIVINSLMQGELDYGYLAANWSTVGLNDGEYELTLLVSCEPNGLIFPPPGIDTYTSAIVFGVRYSVVSFLDFTLYRPLRARCRILYPLWCSRATAFTSPATLYPSHTTHRLVLPT